MNKEANAKLESTADLADVRPLDQEAPSSLLIEERPRTTYAPPSARRRVPPFGAVDLLPFVDALGRRWKWLLLSGIAVAVAGLLGGLWLWKSTYTASAQLLRHASTQVSEVLGDRELEPSTYASLLRAPELLQRVAAHARPPVPAEWLAAKLNVTTERNSDVVLVAISSADRQTAVDLANLYAREAIRFTQELQSHAAARVGLFVTQQLAPLDAEISALGKIPLLAPVGPVVTVVAPSLWLDKLESERVELAVLLGRFTEQHPLVQEQRAKIAAIERQSLRTPAVPAPPRENSKPANGALLTQARDPASILTKLQSLENTRLTLLGKKQAALSVESNPPGTCQLLARAGLSEVIPHQRTAKVAALAVFGGVLGLLVAGSLVLLSEAVDTRLKTAADVHRVTHLPVIASAGDLALMTEAEQKNWAFRAWTRLQGLLSPSPNQGFVCGITSSANGEGRSTWIRLLADAASQRGFRVLTIVATPPEANGKAPAEMELLANGNSDLTAAGLVNGSLPMIANHAVSTPDEVIQKLIGPNPEPVVQIPLPGWVWNLERRKQWQAALRRWSQIDNIALLVELPPASLPETVLLAENLPNLIWLADGEKATAGQTREHLETLRSARCHLAGAVLNHAPAPFLTNRFARWFG